MDSVVHNIYKWASSENKFCIRTNSIFADDTSVIISSRSIKDFCSVYNLVLSYTIQWFVANNLVQNLYKMNKMKFITKNSSHSTLHTGYKVKYIQETVNTKFHVLQTDNH